MTDRDALSRVALEAARASYFRQFGRNFPVPRWDDLPEMAKEGYRDMTAAVLAADPLRQAVTELLARWDTWLDHLPEDALIWGPLAVAADELRAALDGGRDGSVDSPEARSGANAP